MKNISHFIVKFRKTILTVALLLLIPSAIGAFATRINYDILTYLPSDLDSMVGEQSLENDFHLASTAMITVENLPKADLLEMKDDLSKIEGVRDVVWISDFIDVSVPPEMLPSDIQTFMFDKEGDTMLLVTFDGSAASESTMNALKQVKKVVRHDCYIGGMSVILQDTKALVDAEMPMYILIAVLASIFVLFLALKNTVVPFIFMLGLVFPIVYNFGTNIFLGQISYITEALATVLQLGVTMDFSIFLLHRYEEELANHGDEEAMENAIQNTFTSITASSLTTIAGFLALCTMRLTLGADIGIVMAKGVFLGVLCTITILPSLILTFKKPIEKWQHKVWIPKLSKTSNFVTRHYTSVLIIFIIIFIPFAMAQSKTSVYYTLFDSLPQDMTGIVGMDKLQEDFGMTSSYFIVMDEEVRGSDVREMGNEMKKVDGITQVLSLETFMGSSIPSSMLPSAVSDIFTANGRRLVLVNSTMKAGTDEVNNQIEQLTTILKKYDPSGTITGEAPMTKDLIEIADVDFQNVSVASIIAVFVIILLSFKSVSIPVLLVAAIEAAIYINMGIPYFTGTTLPFIASIVIGTIQLGATVDYAILMTTRFREERIAGHDVKEAARIAVENCSQSILSSGLTFFAATVGVSFYSKMELLKSICLLISRGALISMAVIIVVLPCLLIIFEPLIHKTTIGWLKKGNK